MEIVWDARKAASNLKKHKVSFEEASSVFMDSLSITGAVRIIQWVKPVGSHLANLPADVCLP